MTGIEKITARIQADALAEVEAIRAESIEKCAGIKADYDKKAQEEYARLVKNGVRDCESRVSRLGSTAEMEAKKSLLALKQEMVSKAFDRARELLCTLPSEEYISFLAKQAAAAARTGLEELIFNEADVKSGSAAAAVRAANEQIKEKGLYAKLTLSSETRPIMGGLILKEGDIEANCSVEKLTEMCRSSLAAEVAAVMFG